MDGSERLAAAGALLYALCGLMEWGYWIAWAVERGSDRDMTGFILFGWALGIVWPVHLAVEIWRWLL